MPRADAPLSSMSFATGPGRSAHDALLVILLSLMIAFLSWDNSRGILAFLTVGSTVVVIASGYTLKGRMHALESVLNATKDLLADAQESCGLGAQAFLLFEMTRLHRVEILRSDAFCSILELCNCPWGSYPHQVFRLWRVIVKCQRDAKDIRKAIRRIVEDDNKLRLEQDIHNTQEDIGNAMKYTGTLASRLSARCSKYSPGHDA
ncbi:hypothetical protein C8F01DRAFT_760893 [Mycena amicta]|nr:hypothetical protein C8F01DRAFT_760893 [Mycena amicta]